MTVNFESKWNTVSQGPEAEKKLKGGQWFRIYLKIYYVLHKQMQSEAFKINF